MARSIPENSASRKLVYRAVQLLTHHRAGVTERPLVAAVIAAAATGKSVWSTFHLMGSTHQALDAPLCPPLPMFSP